MAHYPAIVIATFLAYLLKVIAGFGASVVLLPILTIIMDIKTATVLASLGDVVSSAIIFTKWRKKVQWKLVLTIASSLFIGTFIGVTIFNKLDANLLKKCFGGFIVIYIMMQVLTSKITKRVKPFKPVFSIPFGLIAGISGGIFNINGPFLVIFMNQTESTKATIKANLIALFFIDSIWRTALFLIKGNITLDTGIVFSIAMLPTLILTIMYAFKLDKKINSKGYNFISRLILLLTGFRMMFS